MRGELVAGIALVSCVALGMAALWWRSRARSVSEIWQPSDEGWFDLTLTITDVGSDEKGYLSVVARGLFQGDKVGLRVSFRPGMKPGIVGSDLDQNALAREGVVFSSIGAESDRLLAAMAKLYGVPVQTCTFAPRVPVQSFALEGHPGNMRQEPIKFKVFFDSADEDDYAELYTNIDIPHRRLELAEKDEEYRVNVVKALSTPRH